MVDKVSYGGWITENGKKRRKTPLELLKRYTIDISTGCHNWQGRKDKDGYGRVNTAKYGTIRTNRLAYMLYVGEIPQGLLIRHLCNNRACINPNHLASGTNQDNMDDREKAGNTARGSKGGNAKLTENDVKTIRSLLSQGSKPSDIADIFNMHVSSICRIRRGTEWRHVI